MLHELLAALNIDSGEIQKAVTALKSSSESLDEIRARQIVLEAKMDLLTNLIGECNGRCNDRNDSGTDSGTDGTDDSRPG